MKHSSKMDSSSFTCSILLCLALNFGQFSLAEVATTVSGEPCLPAPWTYNGLAHMSTCAIVDETSGVAKCLTKPDGVPMECHKIGSCSSTISQSGRACVAFMYNNVTYAAGECTYSDSGTACPWCSVVAGATIFNGTLGAFNSDFCQCCGQSGKKC